ncbi:histidine kinase A [Tieghemostelium lacteum]|uniref:Histidine kinase A n=1 Tax=Tieghemostelium lacteum TaxID=361077 RepID=A0A152A3C9_TIELA|nr:histidine kinase A [Tieghemostelium lacteum]|eukprot:KYR00748.1 histidine kinase A [Tieghemostelium lacteum]
MENRNTYNYHELIKFPKKPEEEQQDDFEGPEDVDTHNSTQQEIDMMDICTESLKSFSISPKKPVDQLKYNNYNSISPFKPHKNELTTNSKTVFEIPTSSKFQANQNNITKNITSRPKVRKNVKYHELSLQEESYKKRLTNIVNLRMFSHRLNLYFINQDRYESMQKKMEEEKLSNVEKARNKRCQNIDFTHNPVKHDLMEKFSKELTSLTGQSIESANQIFRSNLTKTIRTIGARRGGHIIFDIGEDPIFDVLLDQQTLFTIIQNTFTTNLLPNNYPNVNRGPHPSLFTQNVEVPPYTGIFTRLNNRSNIQPTTNPVHNNNTSPNAGVHPTPNRNNINLFNNNQQNR